MLVQERFYTAEDLWEISHLPENEDKRFELIEGVLYEMSPAGWLHGDIASELDFQIRQFAKKHKLGKVTAAETGYILYKNPNGKDTVAAPDVGFVVASRVPQKLPKKYVPFAPDLAVEVVSPGNTTDEITHKVEAYLRYGTKLVWVVYPEQQKVLVYRPADAANRASVEFLDIESTLDGEDILPGFSLPVRDIFVTDEAE